MCPPGAISAPQAEGEIAAIDIQKSNSQTRGKPWTAVERGE
jgi:hypothetical protein